MTEATSFNVSQLDDGEDINLAKSIPALFETVIVVVLLLLFSEALLGPLLADEKNPESSTVLRLMWPPIYLVVFLLMVPRLWAAINLVFRFPVIILLLLWVAASVTWSIDQGVTFRRVLAIGMTTLFGFYLAMRYNWRELLVLFGITWLILGVVSTIVSLAVPAIGVESELHVGAWKGLWFQKNTLGGHMARACLLFGFLAITEPKWRSVWTFGVLMSIALVLLSTSKTALLGMLLGLGILALGAIMRRGPLLTLSTIWSLVIFGGVFVSIIVFEPDLFFDLLGRDSGLTGRTEIWAALQELINQRPIFGYGYGAFWAEGSGPATYVKDLTQWDVPTAHNGWLETWLAVGLVGVVLFAISYVLTIARAVATATKSWVGFFVIGFFLQFALFSMSESIILHQNTIVWVSYIAIAASLVQQNLGRGPIKLLGARRRRDFILVDH